MIDDRDDMMLTALTDTQIVDRINGATDSTMCVVLESELCKRLVQRYMPKVLHTLCLMQGGVATEHQGRLMQSMIDFVQVLIATDDLTALREAASQFQSLEDMQTVHAELLDTLRMLMNTLSDPISDPMSLAWEVFKLRLSHAIFQGINGWRH